jgi:hypothetical protein
VGIRYNVTIFDIQLLMYQIRNSLFFVRQLGYNNALLLLYHSNIVNFPIYFKLFLIDLLHLKNQHSFAYKKWSYGQLSNSFTQITKLFEILFYLDVSKDKENHDDYSTYDILHRLLFFTLSKRLEGMSWIETFNSVYNYWRFFYFFQYYSLRRLQPDCFIYINTHNLVIPILEAEYLNIPTLLVANDSIDLKSSYLIVSNNMTYLNSVFYLSLFNSAYRMGKLSLFSNHIY